MLDDNILSHPKEGKLLEEMAKRNLQVNFNQTLDLRLVDRKIAGLLNRIACSNVGFTRRVIHFIKTLGGTVAESDTGLIG